jgi:hypothetical protein
MHKASASSKARARVSKDEDESIACGLLLRDASQSFELVDACVPGAAMLLSMRASGTCEAALERERLHSFSGLRAPRRPHAAQNSLEIEPDRHGQVDTLPRQFRRRRGKRLRAAQEGQRLFIERARPR